MTAEVSSRLTAPFAALADWLVATLPPRILGARWRAAGDMVQKTPGGRLWLDLAPGQALVRTLALPRGAEARWRDHVAERLAAHSPWTRGAYLWGAEITGRDAEGGLTVCAALAPLELVRDLETQLGREIAAIRLPASGEHPAVLLREDRPLLRRLRRGILAASVGVCAVALAVTALALQAASDSRARATADSHAADRLRTAAAQPATLAETALALLDLRPEAETRSLTLASLAQSLPDTARATAIRLDATGFELSGVAPEPDTLVPLLESDPRLQEVQLSASSARDPATGLFSFTVSGKAQTGEVRP